MPEPPKLTLPHRAVCDGSTHVSAVGFGTDETDMEWEQGDHGESWHPHALPQQCMCGHIPYYDCPDYVAPYRLTDACENARHSECDLVTVYDYDLAPAGEACPCYCHAVPVTPGERLP